MAGSAAAIAATQRDDVHLYQQARRPAHLRFDPHVQLSGDAEEIHFGKISGAHVNFETSYLRRSPGFEINDVGYLQQADQQSWNNWAGLSFNHPTAIYQSLRWNFNWWQYWSAAGLPTERAANVNTHIQWKNRWWLHAGGTLGQLGTYLVRPLRARRAGRAAQDPYLSTWLQIQGDDRHGIIPSFSMNYFESSGGKNHSLNLGPQVTFNASSRASASLGASVTNNQSDNQWYGEYTDETGAAHYTFAHLDQQTVSLTADLAYTITPALSVQWHLQPFISRGTYSNLRELNLPGAADYDARYRPHTPTRPWPTTLAASMCEAVQLQPGGALGIPARVDALRRLDTGAQRLSNCRRARRGGKRSPQHLRLAAGQYVPGKGVVLVVAIISMTRR